MNGITYFKLMNPRYGDDKTKGCALTGAEVDANFNFLRGYDIEKIAIVDQTNLEFKRVNGEVISVDLMDEEVRENVEQLNNEVDDIQHTISEIEETDQRQASAITDYGMRIDRLEDATNILTGSSENHELRIADLERRVRDLERDKEALEQNLNELTDRYNVLSGWIGDATKDTEGSSISLEQAIRNIVARFIHGNPYSVDFDLGPTAVNPQHMDLRFGEDAQFIAGIPGLNPGD